MRITLPPTKKPVVQQKEPAIRNNISPAQERKIRQVINKGGQPTANGDTTTEIASFNIKISRNKIDDINTIRDLLPKRPGKKLPPVSLHAYICDAIDEKLARDARKHNVSLKS